MNVYISICVYKYIYIGLQFVFMQTKLNGTDVSELLYDFFIHTQFSFTYLSEVKHFVIQQPGRVSANYILDPRKFRTDYNIQKIKLICGFFSVIRVNFSYGKYLAHKAFLIPNVVWGVV